MTTEQAQQLAAQAAGAAGGGDPPPAPLNFDELLADETKLDTPVKLADVKGWIEQRDGALIERVRGETQAEFERRERARAEQEQSNATAQEAINFARQIDADILSSDEAVRTAAHERREANREQYRRGLALGWTAESQETFRRSLDGYLSPMFAELSNSEYKGIVEKVNDSQTLAAHNGNWVKAAIVEAERAGYNRGKNEAAEEAEQAGRVTEGTRQAPALSGGTGGRGADDKLFEDIDRTKPGAGRLMIARATEARTQAQGNQRR